jgi:predicted RNase H-like HicB family nuclease
VTSSNYSMLIQWSDEDQLFICLLPEWGEGSKTHGKTYEKAAKAGRQVLESLVEWYVEEGRKLPKPNKFRDE